MSVDLMENKTIFLSKKGVSIDENYLIFFYDLHLSFPARLWHLLREVNVKKKTQKVFEKKTKMDLDLTDIYSFDSCRVKFEKFKRSRE